MIVDLGEDNRRYAQKVEMSLGKGSLFSSRAVRVPLTAQICESCGLVLSKVSAEGLQQLAHGAVVRDLVGPNQHLKKHPLYKEFLKHDQLAKHLPLEDCLRRFVCWLQECEVGPAAG